MRSPAFRFHRQHMKGSCSLAAFVVSLSLILSVADTLQGQTGHQQTAEGMSEAQEKPAASTVAAASDHPTVINMILVKVNGEAILLSELLAKEQEVLPLLQSQFPPAEIEAQRRELLQQLLRALVDERVLLQRAEEISVTVSTNDVDRTIARMREEAGVLTDEQFEQALVNEGLTISALRERVRKELLSQQLIYTEVARNVFVSDPDIDRYYGEHGEDFSSPEKIAIRQLVFLIEGRDPEQIMVQAQAALAELRGGATLEDTVEKYEGAQILGAAEPQPVVLDQVLEQIAEGTAALGPAEYSEPIRTQYGVHIVYLLERLVQNTQPLEEVRDEIQQLVQQEKYNVRYEKYMDDLRDFTQIKIYADEFSAAVREWIEEETETERQ